MAGLAEEISLEQTHPAPGRRIATFVGAIGLAVCFQLPAGLGDISFGE
jgi:hypothetical protein